MEGLVAGLEALAELSPGDYNALLPALQSAVNSPSESNIENVANVIAGFSVEVVEEPEVEAE